MGPQMLFQQHLSGESFAALLALMRFHACVYPDVHIVSYTLIEALPALGASVFLPITMDLHVRAKVAAIVEVFTAFWTGCRELPGTLVNATMVFVVSQLGELLAAIGATKRLLSRVCSDVYLNVISKTIWMSMIFRALSNA